MNETITITGNVATEPEHKLTPGGVSITTFRIASGQRRYDRQTGGWVDGPTNWYSVSTFRSLADHAYDSLHKGDRVILTGRLKVREWETSVRKGTTVEIDAEAIGHDLLWGVSRFEKRGPSASAGRTDTKAPTESTVDAWAAPGVADDVDVEWPTVAVPADGPEGGTLELATAETPF